MRRFARARAREPSPRSILTRGMRGADSRFCFLHFRTTRLTMPRYVIETRRKHRLISTREEKGCGHIDWRWLCANRARERSRARVERPRGCHHTRVKKKPRLYRHTLRTLSLTLSRPVILKGSATGIRTGRHGESLSSSVSFRFIFTLSVFTRVLIVTMRTRFNLRNDPRTNLSLIRRNPSLSFSLSPVLCARQCPAP